MVHSFMGCVFGLFGFEFVDNHDEMGLCAQRAKLSHGHRRLAQNCNLDSHIQTDPLPLAPMT